MLLPLPLSLPLQVPGCALREAYTFQRQSYNYIWPGDVSDENRMLYATRLFAALRSAISTLEEYYLSLAPSFSGPQSEPRYFPFVRNFLSKTFRYLSRLDLEG